MVAGVDEAGRGPLAGPVVAAAVIIDCRLKIRNLLNLEGELEKISSNAIERAKTYDWEDKIQYIIEIYQNVLK